MARAKKENIPVCKYNTSIDCRQMEEPSTVERQCEHCGWCPREQKRRKKQIKKGLIMVD